MSFLKNIFSFKRIAIVVSLVIVSLILWNTYVFFNKFKSEERLKMEILANAQEELSTNTNLDASTKLPLAILENNTSIPMILADENNQIIYHQNLDSVKALKPEYLVKQLQIMKDENDPVEIKISNGKKQYVYYRNSDLLNKLTYYPLALILILALFLAVIYMMFRSNKISEQNRLWTGMAKETAHQIGTPLSSLLGWIAILKTEKVDDKYINEIEKDVHRLNTIANRFSKIGSLPELKQQDVVAVSRKAFDYLESRSSKQVQFSFSTDAKQIDIPLNEELFGWVIENLIKNAIDAMQGKGSVSLEILGNKKHIVLNISDTGKGISKKIHKHIFKPGFTTKKRGWGLGLSLSKRIVEDYHKGKIFVANSTIGKGTTFQIILNK